MKIITNVTPRVIPLAILATVSFLAVASRPAVAQTITWSGSAAPTLNWSDTGNWFGGVVPGSTDIVIFDNTAASGTAGVVTNIVSTSATSGTLRYQNTGTNFFHTTQINAGQTLTIGGFSTNGTGTGTVNTVNFTGGGSLFFNNTSGTFELGQAYSPAGIGGAGQTNTVDMSSLDTFTANAQLLRLGFPRDRQKSTSTLRLAGSNSISVGEINIPSANNGFLVLGTSNTLNVDTFSLVTPGSFGTADIRFATGLTNPSLVIRNRAGTGDANLNLAWATVNGNEDRLTTGTIDLRGGHIDARFGTVNMGSGRFLSNSGGSGNATILFDSGTVSMNHATLGQSISNVQNNIGTGIIDVGGTGVLTTGTLLLANSSNATAWTNARGIVRLSGSAVLQATTIGTGSTSGVSLRRIEFTSGTIGNRAATDLSVASLVDVLLVGGGTRSFEIAAGQTGTVSGTISGLGGFAKTGAGSLILNAANTFTGPTALTSGSLVIGNANALQNSTLELSAGTGVSFNQDSTLGGLGGVPNVNAGGFSLTIGDANSITTFSGDLTTPALTKVGSGVLLLTGSNTLSTATVSAGGLGFGRRTSAPSGATTVASGATIGLGVGGDTATYYSASDIDALFLGTFSGVNNTAGVSNVGIDTSSGDFTYASNITGPRGLAKFGTNTLTLSGNNTFSGGIQVAGGRVVPHTAGAIGSGTVTIASGTFDVGSLANVTNPVTVTGTGSLAVAVGNSYAGTTRIEGGTLLFNSAAGVPTQEIGPLVFEAGAGGLALARPVDQDLKVTVGSLTRTAGAVGNFVPGGGTNSATNGVSISSGTAGFINSGVYFGGSNFAWYEGTGTNGFVRGINYGSDAGTRTTGSTASNQVSIAHQQFTGNASGQQSPTYTTLAFTETVTSYATINTISYAIDVRGLLKSGTGTTIANAAFRAPANTDLDIRVDSVDGGLRIAQIVANGVNGLNKSGLGTLTLAGSGTFSGPTGPTRPLEGTIVVAGTNALQNSTLELSAAGSGLVRFDLPYSANGVAPSVTLGGLSGTRDLDFGRIGGAVIGNNNASTAYSGILSGILPTGTLTKIGTGTLTLSGSSTFAGVTSINNGAIETNSLPAAGQASAIGTGGTINLGSGSTTGSLRYTGSGDTTDRVINLAGTTGGGVIDSSGAGALQFTSPLTAAATAKNLTLAGSSTAANSIAAILSPVADVIKTGPGLWRLTAASTFTGRLNVLDGTIVAAVGVGTENTAGVFGAGTADGVLPVVGDSAAGVTGQAAVLLEAGVTISRGLVIAGLGSEATQEAILGMASSSGTGTFGGATIRLGRDLTLQAADGGTVRFETVWKDADGGDNPAVAFTIGSAGNAGTVELDSFLPDSITAVNVRRGTLKLDYQDGFGATIGYATPVTIGETGFGGTLDVNDINQQLASLSFAGVGSTVLGSGTLRLFNNGSTAVVNVAGIGHTLATALALDNAASFTVAAGGRLGISSGIADGLTPGEGLTKSGLGILELSGMNSYTGITNVSAGGLLVSGTNMGTGLVSVAAGWIGGRGSLAGGLTLGSTAGLVFDPAGALNVLGSVTIDSLFGVDSLVGVNGLGIDWNSIDDGTYKLIGITTSTFDNIRNFGSGNAYDIGGGRSAYFQNGSLELVIVPEPGALALAALGIAAAAAAARRRRAVLPKVG